MELRRVVVDARSIGGRGEDEGRVWMRKEIGGFSLWALEISLPFSPLFRRCPTCTLGEQKYWMAVKVR